MQSFSLHTCSGRKYYENAAEAVKDVVDGNTLLVGGFGLCGIPENLIQAVLDNGAKNLTIVSNECGTNDFGLGLLLRERRVKRVLASFIGSNSIFEKQYLSGDLELKLVPQGSLAERLRAGGAGIPAFYTPTGVGTLVEQGGLPILFDKNGKDVKIASPMRDTRVFNGRRYILEEAIHGDFALVKCYKADKAGNLVFHQTARNFNPDCAMASGCTIAEADHVVETGELKPDEIHLPGIFVHRVIQGVQEEKRIEKLTLNTGGEMKIPAKNEAQRQQRLKITQRATKEIKDGMYVNLGIGIPTLCANFIPEEMDVFIHSENGLLGMGPYPKPGEEDPDLINAGKETVTVRKGGVFIDSHTAFNLIRGAHLDLSILGGLQVSRYGDLANFMIPGVMAKGIGGAMDLCAGIPRIVVTMTHSSKHGDYKLVNECSLPLTGPRCVKRVITDLAVFDFTKDGPLLIELSKDTNIEEVRSKTQFDFRIVPGKIPVMEDYKP